MIDKIDIRDIVRDHYKSLSSYATGKSQKRDYMLFLGLPFVLSLLAAGLAVDINDAAVGVVITAVAILAGLLFNLLVLLHAIKSRDKTYVTAQDTKRFFAEIYANISYAILIALFSLIPLAFVVMINNQYALTALNAIAVFLCVHLLLTLLMILKRIHALLRIEF